MGKKSPSELGPLESDLLTQLNPIAGTVFGWLILGGNLLSDRWVSPVVPPKKYQLMDGSAPHSASQQVGLSSATIGSTPQDAISLVTTRMLYHFFGWRFPKRDSLGFFHDLLLVSGISLKYDVSSKNPYHDQG